MPNRFGGVGVALPLNQLGTNGFTLQAGEVFYVPSGYFNLAHGPYSTVQTFDPVMNVWRPVGADGTSWFQVDSDGNNYRIANQTGCPVGAVLSNAGSAYTSAPTIAAAAGSSVWTAIMGQVVSTAVVVATAGSNYVYPPLVLFQAPPTPGIVATGQSVITSGAVTSITVINQGAGYQTAPFVTLLNDPRDTTGNNATAVAALTGAQTVTAVVCTNHGIPITSGTVPALTFTGGGGTAAAATIVMDWTVTSYAVTGGGLGYSGAVEVTVLGTGSPTIASAYVNPASQSQFLRSRAPVINAATSAGAITATGQLLLDGGHLGSVPSGTTATNNTQILTFGGVLTGSTSTVATLTLGVGGVSDFLWIQQG